MGCLFIPSTMTHDFITQHTKKRKETTMRVQVAIKLANNVIRYQIFDGVEASINTRNVLEISTLYNKRLIAQFPPENYAWWRYVAPPQATATSRAGQLLQHHGV